MTFRSRANSFLRVVALPFPLDGGRAERRVSVLRERLPGLDGLRVVAALCVLFAHGGYFLFAAWPNYDAYAFAGWFGTELFFALAGFLLVAHLLVSPPRSGADIRRWWWWCAWRAMPLFWLALALHVLLARWANHSPGVDAAAFAILAQSLAWPPPAFFGEAWNLPVLVLFMLVAPILARMAGGAPNAISRMTWLLVGWIVAGIVVRTIWVLQTEPLWDAGVRKIVLSRLDACAYGGLAACAAARLRGGGMIAAALTILLWGIAAAGFFVLPRDASLVAGAGLFVLAGAGSALAVVAVGSSARPMPTAIRTLSRWSYPLYLVNMPVLLAMTLLGFGQGSDAADGMLRFILWLTVSILLAAVIHRFAEAPLMAMKARRLAHPCAASAMMPTIR